MQQYFIEWAVDNINKIMKNWNEFWSHHQLNVKNNFFCLCSFHYLILSVSFCFFHFCVSLFIFHLFLCLSLFVSVSACVWLWLYVSEYVPFNFIRKFEILFWFKTINTFQWSSLWLRYLGQILHSSSSVYSLFYDLTLLQIKPL